MEKKWQWMSFEGFGSGRLRTSATNFMNKMGLTPETCRLFEYARGNETFISIYYLTDKKEEEENHV